MNMADEDDDNLSLHSVESTNSYNNKPARDVRRKKTPAVRPFNLPPNVSNVTIAMIIEESLLDDAFDDALNKEFIPRNDFISNPHRASASAGNSNNANNNSNNGIKQNEIMKKYTYLPLTTPLPGVIHWIKCDHFNQLHRLIQISCGGSTSDECSVPLYSTFSPFFEYITLVVVTGEEFCERIIPSDTEVPSNLNNGEFPKLDEWVKKIITKLSQAQTEPAPGREPYQPRLIFAFVDLDKPCLKIQRKLNKDGRPIALQERLDQALIHLTLTHDIEIFRCKKITELAEYLHTMTRILETNVEKSHITSFDCVMKASKSKAPDTCTDEERRIFELQQTWGAMLQMLPLMSKEKANSFISNPAYSCIKRVFSTLNDESEPEKKRMSLVQNEFGKTKNGTQRNESKLAKHVFKLMTVVDPAALLQEEGVES